MRITNSMMIDNVLRDLNSGLMRTNKYASQLSSNRKMTRLSDNPVGLINSLGARQQISQIQQYRANIITARKWTQAAETAVTDMNSIITTIKENVIDAGGTKNASDKQNIAALVKQLKEHLFETCNAAVGDKYIFAGFNSTKKPFTVDTDGNVLYNGINLADVAPQPASFTPPGGSPITQLELTGHVNPVDKYTVVHSGLGQIAVTNESGSLNKTIDISEAAIKQSEILDANGVGTGVFRNELQVGLNDLQLGTIVWECDGTSTLDDALHIYTGGGTGQEITCGLYGTMTDIVTKNTLDPGNLNSITWDGPITASDKYYFEVDGADITIKDSRGTVVTTQTITTAGGAAETLDLTAYGLGTITWDNTGSAATADEIAASIASAGFVTTQFGEENAQDIRFETGFQTMIDATFTGIDVVGTGNDNMFKVLDDLVAALEAGADNDVLTTYITRLTTVSDRLLSCAVELGARSQKLETLENRYSMDAINAEAVRTDVEDIDPAETIMNMKFAESIYQQALAAGAMIIQPTLMDFLN